MNSRDLSVFLGLQVSAFLVAQASFHIFESRLVAGGVAGGFIVLAELYMLARAWRWSDKWKSPTWYMVLVHLFGMSLPIFVTRFLQPEVPFQEMTIMGLPAPAFHGLSGAAFGLFVLSTIVDWVRVYRRK